MFSVDNFYDFLDSHYGWECNQTTLWRFFPHGSKNFADLLPHFDNEKFHKQQQIHDTHGAIILHDQEPFAPYLIDTYKNYLFEEKKEAMWAQVTRKELLYSHTHNCSWPLFCHSEHNSRDIKYISSIGYIECHYLWHGLISRDWFRHWRLRPELDKQHQWQQRFLLYAREFTGSREYRQQVVESLRPMQDQIKHTWDGNNPADSSYSAKIVVEDAVDTAVHIVSETVFDQNKIHITEKIFKPVVMRQPFIVFAGAGTLEYLRGYGFQTFGDIWDESYDKILDHSERLQKVLDVITTLYRLPPKEFQQKIDRCQQILDHNRRHFFGNEFENIMLAEMHNNISRGLDQQKRLLMEDPGGAVFNMIDSVRQRKIDLARNVQGWIKPMAGYMKDFQPQRYQTLIKQYPWVPDYL